MTDQAHALDLERSAAAFQAFNAALVKPTPKAQWNAATVIRAIILQRPEVPPYIIETMLDVLSSSKNVKVKASIFAALENVKDLRRIPDALEKLLAAKDSLQAMRDDLPFAELGRAETLMASVSPCRIAARFQLMETHIPATSLIPHPLTDSGLPRFVACWRSGQPVFERQARQRLDVNLRDCVFVIA